MRVLTISGAVAGLLAVALAGVPAGAQGDWLGDPIVIRTLSNRADLVSGGDALVELELPGWASLDGITVEVGGRDITDAFARRDDGRVTGRVEGLANGLNRVTVTTADGSGAFLDIVNHPRGGPVFAGEQVQPWTCTTEAAGLGPALDGQCNADPVFSFYYKNAATGRFEVYDPDSPPAEGSVAMTTTDQGVTVPYIVRTEVGAMDRGIYAVAVLFDPAQEWEPWAPQPGWNHKLYQAFGGGCYFQHNQGTAPLDMTGQPGVPTIFDDARLSRGFLVTASSLNTYGHNCNDVVSAEAFMMTKEHVVDRYGEIRYTMTEGGSGGSVLQDLMADNYPGLSDGLQPYITGFADMWIVAVFDLPDCELLENYFGGAGMSWTPDQRAAVEGKALSVTCTGLAGEAGEGGTFGGWWHPAGNCVDAEVVFDPESNPDGVRCTLTDYMVSIFGRRPDGRANRLLDNVGVQYGLAAMEAGQISVDQFIDLNASIGGLDIDGNKVPERMVADPPALVAGYEVGYSDGDQLERVPIINYLTFVNADIHQSFESRVLQARLIAANGHADNQVIMNDGFDAANSPARSFALLDEWLAAIEADTSDDPIEVKVVRNRPERADAEVCRGPGSEPLDPSVCDTAFPWYGMARFVAGMPWEREVLKCELQPLDRDAYAVEFTDEQWATLEATFPDGVCDWTQPGVGERANEPWPSFADGPGGEPLGPEPTSVPFGPDGPPPLVTRHDGPTRIETAVAVSALGVDSADTVVLARADAYADALAGAPLAVHLGAPLLLTPPAGLAGAVAEEITRLGATEAVLLGGEAALSGQVASDLEALGLTVRRIQGPNRFATAAGIAAELPPGNQVLLARGDGFADALAASGLASTQAIPILLVEPGRLPEETAATLSSDDDVVIIGGEAAVPQGLAEQVDALADQVRRIGGATRYATAAGVADEAVARGVIPSIVWLATGADFPDALVAGAAAGRDHAVLLLTDPDSLDASPETAQWLADHAAGIEEVRIAGGLVAVSGEIEASLAEG